MNCLNSFFFHKKVKKKKSVQLSEQKLQNTSECTKPFVQQKCHLDIEQ